ncbi:MAG: OsmC family protein [Myxococcales bacterium]|nr:OsmC family protein [Myxococcales bacterium]
MTITTNNTNLNADNGVNVEALLGAREQLSGMPAAAQFKWRATCEWINGAHSRSTVQNYFGLGAEQSHRTKFTLDADHPELFAASDNGVTPPELALTALASCLTAGVASIAQMRKIQLHSVTATLEGDMDVLAILGADTDARNGFSNITVRFEIDADASEQEIEALVAQSQKRSAVFDIISNPTNINVEACKA